MIPFVMENAAAFAPALIQYQGQKEANQANITHSVENRDWQERMSSTAYQRSTEDLKKAGLNPLLALGSQASTPSGSVPSIENAAEGLSSSVLDATRLFNDIKKQKAEIDLLKSQKNNTDMNTTVQSKGVPQADITNKIYKLVEPVLNKLTDRNQTTAHGPGKLEQRKETQDAVRRMQKQFNLSKP